MTEVERQKERLHLEEMEARFYYSYENRFITQKLEGERIAVLPRVVKPAMFARGGHALGDVRVFERYSVAPVSSLTCRFLDMPPGARTERQRTIPSTIVYILDGRGECIQGDRSCSFAADDVVVIPAYTTHQFVARGDEGFRAWVPQMRLWHVAGLLWQEQFEFDSVPEGTEPIRRNGELAGFRVPRGVLGLQQDLEVLAGADAKREQFFDGRRAARRGAAVPTRYDYFLRLLEQENELEQQAPRVLRGGELPWEKTRQGRLKYFISLWTQLSAGDLCVMAQEIEPGGHSGKHRHFFEELMLVTAGSGYDLHEETRYPWEAGDLICIPPMTAHQHHNDGTAAAHLVSVWPQEPAGAFMGGIEHISDASGWQR